jgi:hypothetical protein
MLIMADFAQIDVAFWQTLAAGDALYSTCHRARIASSIFAVSGKT